MEVICMEDETFFSLIEKVVERIKEKQDIEKNIWLTTEEAMLKLKISSKATLQKIRDEGRIIHSRVTNKLILYNSNSIDDYLDNKSQNKF